MVSTLVAELRAMPDDALLNELEESQRALFNVRFQAATRQLADVSQVRSARRRVARVKTLLRERAILAEYGELLGTAEAPDAAAAAPDAAADEADEAADDADEAADDADDAAADADEATEGEAAEDDATEADGERE